MMQSRRDLPVLIASLCVLLMVPVLLGLGAWQLNRAQWKDALLARLEANTVLPAVPLPAQAVDAGWAFRAVDVECERWDVPGGYSASARNRQGQPGFGHVLLCRRTAGPPLAVNIGWSARAPARLQYLAPLPQTVRGVLVPTQRESIAAAGALPFVLYADPGLGLPASQAPDAGSIPDNHLSYAVQWFSFAFILLVIYGLFIRQWRRTRQR